MYPNLPIVPSKLSVDYEQMVTKLENSSNLGNQYKHVFRGMVEIPIKKMTVLV